MKRRHQGWPPLTSAKHCVSNARQIEQAIAEQEARTLVRHPTIAGVMIAPDHPLYEIGARDPIGASERRHK